MRLAGVAALALAALWPATATASAGGAGLQWQAFEHLEGVFDVAGPLPDGRVVAATSKGLLEVDPTNGGTTALGPKGDQQGEAYIAVAPSLPAPPAGTGCAFAQGDVYQLRLGGTPGVNRIDLQGTVHRFADLGSAGSLNGIAFDATGRFGHRLLVSGAHRGGSTVVALDCAGRGRLVTDQGPTLEGGLAVAPASFGRFGGDLVAPDELTGKLLAIRPDGTSAVIASSGLPTGQDIGVEGVGFVPAGFSAGGEAYFSDRATSNNAHLGTDTLLRLDAAQLSRAGVREGDLVVATEGGARTIGVRCTQSCRVYTVGQGSGRAHGEGHVLVRAQHLQPAGALPAERLGTARDQAGLPGQAVALVVIVALGVIGAMVWLPMWRRKRRQT
ncbi:MAG: hypothetical protein J2P45_01165 [Candidatus Dormibacteraeota bacterium]|nr:hypothetical protein [Candidatus Dormibacteraeota bacterium]